VQTKFSELSNAIRFLSIDAVQKANSGHPGMPMGMADVATVLFKYYLRFNPENPSWINRDRFILSAGHGSMLLYSLLYLTGYKKFSLDQIKNFRQLSSICAGHPEYEPNSGIETTTGPLGQGLANAVGIALAEKILSKRFSKKIIDHKTYVIASDGDLMEGISHEAMSFAGHYNLNNLIVFFDNNKISIDGKTSLSVSDNYKKRFESYGWNFQDINGHKENEINKAIKKAIKSNKPSIISCRTIIGYGSPNKSGKSSSHGSPLGDEEIKLVRKKLKWHYREFEIPKHTLDTWRAIGKKGTQLEKKWNQIVGKSDAKKKLEKFSSGLDKSLLKSKILIEKEKYFASKPALATRQCSAKVIEVLNNNLSNIVGGSADLSGSNNTNAPNSKVINKSDPTGNYIHYGVREHGMAAIMNGLALHSNLIPFGGTFLIFSDYCKPSIRLSALMNLNVIYIFSHDSIGLGEDGPTHQPIEQLAGLRAIPNLNVFRPADINETFECWEIALTSKNNPSAIILSRQKLPYITNEIAKTNYSAKGAYCLKEVENPKVTLIASGSEVELALDIQKELDQQQIKSKVISIPCVNIFNQQDNNYKNSLISDQTINISIEAGSTYGWSNISNSKIYSFGINSFGKSGPYKELFDHFKLTKKEIVNFIKNKL
jgi:transketolase